jgi:hypothetical protein
MALTIDWPGRIVNSDASISDIVAFHAELRDAEDSEAGIVHPVIHTWRALALGGGAIFPQIDFVNGWQLRFPVAGSYIITGNLNATIVPVAGVFVDRRASLAFAAVDLGGGGGGGEGASAAQVWAKPVEDGITAEGALRILLAAMSGRSTGARTGVERYLARDNVKARITAQFDSSGNRINVAVDGTP